MPVAKGGKKGKEEIEQPAIHTRTLGVLGDLGVRFRQH